MDTERRSSYIPISFSNGLEEQISKGPRKVVFVSHCKKDINKVNTLIQELRDGDFEVTRSYHGKDVPTSHITRAVAFVVCLSRDYCADDECHTEFLMLHWQEKPLLPVVLDSESWPPGDKLHMHRDYFWKLNPIMLNLSNGNVQKNKLVSCLNAVLGITDGEVDGQYSTWGVESPRKFSASPAAISDARRAAKDADIMAQLALQSIGYEKLPSAPPSVSGRDRSKSAKSIRDKSATSGNERSSSRFYDSRRSSLLTIATVEESTEKDGGEELTENIETSPEYKESGLETVQEVKSSRNAEDNLPKQSNKEEQNLEKADLSQIKTSQGVDHGVAETPMLKPSNELEQEIVSGEMQSKDSESSVNNLTKSTDVERSSKDGTKKSKSCTIL